MDQFNIAGFRYYDGAKELPRLAIGSRLMLRPEPANPYDPFAVEILHDAVKLGYVPRFCNRHISRLLQQDIPLACAVGRIKPNAVPWEAVQVQILMRATSEAFCVINSAAKPGNAGLF
jgi:hypothetical protein